ncbi:cytosolic endo-beta-N-acetylglucosaminidase isoform X1 [Dipodomys spectabilis]|uniref:cytosolic endo-beta-N-acetylglucosaminidase isoform X1 n=2 Tax=Dipodomys spectabilis TaxID=105255 RepID=UPI001C538660|nr:cytosolic endo-beta-N-acetylglucosaminidase isoform X1 [Dipodomys spectabilis]
MDAPAVLTRAAARRKRQQGLASPEARTPEGRERRPGRRRPARRIQEDQEEAAAAEAVFREVVSFSSDPLPARYYDKDTAKPISFYLSSLEELLAWTPLMEDSFNMALEPLQCRQPPLSSPRPRTLLCHDMMGGYLEDRFIQGAAVQTPYSFYHWQYVDIFVYFSHHTVTIPPVGWTNAAHRHGVSVLGTFITEWSEGGRLCEAFLAGEQRSYQAVADQLVQIAQFFRFDGWLINIENSLSRAAVGNTPAFLRYLTSQLHRQVPGGLVLWYDSVVQSGQLKWQDELNEHNRVFFDACDGFFTNYNWREEHLQRMLALVGERLADVYVGVDVFARGKVVGGRFDTDKSLELIRKHGFSAALFAPGWVYECLEKKDFFQNQDKFWGLLERYLPTHSICSLPLVTSFCLGMGKRRVCYGQEQVAGPWYHPSAQEVQPLFGEHRLAGHSQGWVKTHGCLADAWHGGSSLLIRGVIPPEVGSVAVRLFSLQVPVPPKIFLSMVYKLEGSSDVKVALELTTGDTGCAIDNVSVLSAEAGSRHSPRPLRVPPTKLARWVGRCGQQRGGGWIQRCYEVSLRECLLQDLFVSFSRTRGSQEEESFACRLGEIQVVDAESLLAPLPQVQDVTISQVRWLPPASGSEGPLAELRLSCTLHWSYLLRHARGFRIHWRQRTRGGSPSPERPTFLGLAFAAQYRVVDLLVVATGPGQEGRVEFLVEPVPREGFVVPQAEWGRAALVYAAP